MRVDRPVRTELREPEDRVLDLALLQERDELVAQARRRKVADEAHLDRSAREAQRVLVHPEAVAVLVADPAEDAGRIVDEREVVEDADPPRLEVAPPAERVDEAAVVLPPQGDRHRIDGEV